MSNLIEALDVHYTIMRATSGGIYDDAGHVPMSQLQERIHHNTRMLHRHGVSPNEPVLVPVSGCANDVSGILGIIGAGAVAVPIHQKSHVASSNYIQNATGARFVVEVEDQSPGQELGLTQIKNERPKDRPLLEGAAFITFTSGSTGEPKGVVLSRQRVASKYQAILAATGMGHAPVSVVPLQLLFSFGQWASLLPLMLGGTVHLTNHFKTAWVENIIKEKEVDFIAAVPTMLRMMIGSIQTDQSFDVLTGGEAVGANLRKKIHQSWPQTTVQSIFGLTETGTCDLYRKDKAPDDGMQSLGFPSPGVEVATDPNSRELLIHSPYAMMGYLDMPELTAITLRDGWIRTGDQADILASGEVILKGRIKELINRGGNKVSPLEVEAIFQQHQDVVAALATSVPDDRFGEAIHLLIIPAGTSKSTALDLLDWARPQMDRFKLPDVLHFGTKIPLGNTGKADRVALREMILSQDVA